ncbi:hypothetical protein [Fodinibius saliphilus]|uniref:hypothetical protein n=1 Tax=Fodinibius saliphilus TaxID=1920650 RepID=UPI001108F6D4|nr:hypothetical protein [Fodinibius saliphilus]
MSEKQLPRQGNPLNNYFKKYKIYDSLSSFFVLPSLPVRLSADAEKMDMSKCGANFLFAFWLDPKGS